VGIGFWGGEKCGVHYPEEKHQAAVPPGRNIELRKHSIIAGEIVVSDVGYRLHVRIIRILLFSRTALYTGNNESEDGNESESEDFKTRRVDPGKETTSAVRINLRIILFKAHGINQVLMLNPQ
jgi:hypothetical protein